MTHDPNVITHKNESQTLPPNKRQLNLSTSKKTNYAAPAFWGNSRREDVFTRRPPINHTTETTVECTGTPTEAWLRQQAIASMKRPPPGKEQEATFLQDQDYKRDYQNHTKQITVTTQIDHIKNAPDDHFHRQRLRKIFTIPPRHLSRMTTFPPRSTQSKST